MRRRRGIWQCRAWENMLTENEIWQVILYLYQTTGHKPRVMEVGGGSGH